MEVSHVCIQQIRTPCMDARATPEQTQSGRNYNDKRHSSCQHDHSSSTQVFLKPASEAQGYGRIENSLTCIAPAPHTSKKRLGCCPHCECCLLSRSHNTNREDHPVTVIQRGETISYHITDHDRYLTLMPPMIGAPYIKAMGFRLPLSHNPISF